MYIQGSAGCPADPCGRGRHGPDGASGSQGVAGQERREVRAHPDGPDAGPAAAVGDAERLVEVEVADVGAELARPGVADERIEVGAVDVHLPAGIVDRCRTASRTSLSNTPWVDGYVIMIAASRSPTEAIFARTSSRSTLPRSSQFTTTTSMPAITALAAFVPWALEGIRQTVRSSSPRDRW